MCRNLIKLNYWADRGQSYSVHLGGEARVVGQLRYDRDEEVRRWNALKSEYLLRALRFN